MKGGGRGIFLRGKKGHDCDENDIKRGSSPSSLAQKMLYYFCSQVHTRKFNRVSSVFSFLRPKTRPASVPLQPIFPLPLQELFFAPRGGCLREVSQGGEKFQTVAGGGMHRALYHLKLLRSRRLT